MPNPASGKWWFRIRCDGTTVKIRALTQDTAPNDSEWSAVGDALSSSNFVNQGGRIGFMPGTGYDMVADSLTVKSDTNADGSGYANDTPTYSPAGNPTL